MDKNNRIMKRLAALAVVAVLSLAGCGAPDDGSCPGYVEGEFVYVAAKLAGRLDDLAVTRGTVAPAGASLFTLEHDYEADAVKRAEAMLERTEDNLRDKEKGLRPEEIQQIEASLERTKVEKELAALEHRRRIKLYADETISREELDQAQTKAEAYRAQVRELEAKLATGKLSARVDQVMAARAEVEAARMELAQARWSLDQKFQSALVGGLVYDVLHYKGEWVNAGAPVVALLPPENVKVRFFAPEEAVGRVKLGQAVTLRYDGAPGPVAATVSYVSPKAEYAPPVIYSQGFRSKLVFMVEARFDPETAATLHPGQPVDVTLFPKEAS